MPGIFGEILYAAVAAEADGANEVIAAVSGKKLRIVGYSLTVDVTGKVALQDDAGTPVVHAQLHLLAGTPVAYSGGLECPAFEIAAGQAFDISNPAGTNTYGHVAYVQV